MPSKGLKPAIPRPSARDALAAADQVAQQAGLPPASLAPASPGSTSLGLTSLGLTSLAPMPLTPPSASRHAADAEALVQLNIRVRRSLGDQLADRARAEGTTQKVLLCRALAAAGFAVHADDLAPTPPPRRRGSKEA